MLLSNSRIKLGVLVLTITMLILLLSTGLSVVGYFRLPEDNITLARELTGSLLNRIDDLELDLVTGEFDRIKTEELITVAQKRKNVMLSLIEENITEATNLFLPEDVRKRLPNSVQPYIENYVSIEGRAEILHADEFGSEISRFLYFLESNGTQVSLHSNSSLDDIEHLDSNAKVSVAGYKLGNKVVTLGKQNLQIIEEAEDRIIGNQNILVIFAVEHGSNFNYLNEEVVSKIMSSANDYIKEVSYGKASIKAEKILPVSVNDACSAKSVVAAADPLVDFQEYDSVMVFSPSTAASTKCGCAFGYIDKITWVTGDGKVKMSYAYLSENCSTLRNVLHELGHGFGLLHANMLDCQKRSFGDVGPDGCKPVEYGDFYDVMGGGKRVVHFNSYHKEKLGWIDENKITVTSSGTYILSPIEKYDGLLVIKIPWGEDFYYLEYRKPIGFDEDLPTSGQDATLIHFAPRFIGRTTSNLVSLPLSVRGEYVDKIKGIGIKFVENGADAKIKVTHFNDFVDLTGKIVLPKKITLNTKELEVYLTNLGTVDAYGANVTLLDYTTGEILGTKIVDLAAKESINTTLAFASKNISGLHEIGVRLEFQKDSNQENNIYRTFSRVFPDKPDLVVSMQIDKTKKDVSAKLKIENRGGKSAKDVDAKLYSNAKLIWNSTIEIPDGYIWSENIDLLLENGPHTIKFYANTEEEYNNQDNTIEKDVFLSRSETIVNLNIKSKNTTTIFIQGIGIFNFRPNDTDRTFKFSDEPTTIAFLDINKNSNRYNAISFDSVTISENLSAFFEPKREKTVGQDITLYTVYPINVSWSYKNIDITFIENLSALGMLNTSAAGVYSCDKFNFVTYLCNSKWSSLVTSKFEGFAATRHSNSDTVTLEASIKEAQAVALGEPNFCGDTLCSVSESCSSCSSDCGKCPEQPTVPSSIGSRFAFVILPSGSVSPEAIVTTPIKITETLKPEKIHKVEDEYEIALSLDVKRPEIAIDSIRTIFYRDVIPIPTEISFVPLLPSVPTAEKAYQYLEIVHSDKLDTDIKVVNIVFKVNKTWIKVNNINRSSITLQRFENTWKKLQTDFLKEDSSFVFYTAVSPGFSTFAITGDNLPTVKENELLITTKSERIDTTTNTTDFNICKPGIRLCYASGLRECNKGLEFVVIENCEFGCLDGKCRTKTLPDTTFFVIGFVVLVIIVAFIIVLMGSHKSKTL